MHERFWTLNLEDKVALAKGVMMGVSHVGRLGQGERKGCWIKNVLLCHFNNSIFYSSLFVAFYLYFR